MSARKIPGASYAAALLAALLAGAPRGGALAEDLALDADQRAHLGIETAPAEAAVYAVEHEGYGVVLAHDAIAQALADAKSAAAAARLSHAVLARMEGLAGTPGADTAEAHDAAVHQVAADDAALALARRKMSALLGDHPPWSGRDQDPLLEALAAGTRKLVRITFPSGRLAAPGPGGAPSALHLAPLDDRDTARRWIARPVWAAPADPAIPGRSVFAVLPAEDIAEGERLLGWAAAADGGAHGVWIPASAVLMHDGRYWCYVERKPGLYVRIGVDVGRPLRDGYFLDSAAAPGEPIVIRGAGLLLARETNPSPAGGD